MTLDNVKERLLERIAGYLEADNLEKAERCIGMYNGLIHGDVQTKMTDAHINGKSFPDELD